MDYENGSNQHQYQHQQRQHKAGTASDNNDIPLQYKQAKSLLAALDLSSNKDVGGVKK